MQISGSLMYFEGEKAHWQLSKLLVQPEILYLAVACPVVRSRLKPPTAGWSLHQTGLQRSLTRSALSML